MARTFRFEDVTLDPTRREVLRDGRPVAVEPRVFDLLVYLIDNRDRLVSKDDLVAALWQGRVVSDAALTSAINAARRAIGDSGEAQRLIRTMPKKGLRFVGELHGDDPPAEPEAAARPSIAVLPFVNLGDGALDYLVDGIVEEIMTALARSKAATVIARGSSFAYKGKPVDAREVGRQLGVRYVLEGSVRIAGERLRITGRLVETAGGAQVWSDRFEGTLGDMFALQDRLAANVVVAMLPHLQKAELHWSHRKPIANLQAYDHYLRGRDSLYKSTRPENGAAIAHFAKALALDPTLAIACAWMAESHKRRNEWGWSTDVAGDLREAEAFARRAVALDDRDPRVLAIAGATLTCSGARNLEEGIGLLDRALALDPTHFSAWNWRGWASLIRGDGDALRFFEPAMLLSPANPYAYFLKSGIAAAHFLAGRHAEASSLLAEVLRHHPSQHLWLWLYAASSAHAGRLEEARAACRRMLEVAPGLRLSNAPQWLITPNRRVQELAVSGLRLAGLPE